MTLDDAQLGMTTGTACIEYDASDRNDERNWSELKDRRGNDRSDNEKRRIAELERNWKGNI